jgi:hypothetical protein
LAATVSAAAGAVAATEGVGVAGLGVAGAAEPGLGGAAAEAGPSGVVEAMGAAPEGLSAT